MALLKIFRSSRKHSQLVPGDEKCLAKEEGEPSSVTPDAVGFTVKYLGSTIVSNTRVTSATAIETILTMAKVTKRKPYRVTLNVTLNGITVTDAKTGSVVLDASVYRISNCSTDPGKGNIFNFFATNKYDITECHAFRCSKIKTAATITLAVAHSFKAAFEKWQGNHLMCSEIMLDEKSERLGGATEVSDHPLIDFLSAPDENDTVDNVKDNTRNWVRFESEKDDGVHITNNANRNVESAQPPRINVLEKSSKNADKHNCNIFLDNGYDLLWTE